MVQINQISAVILSGGLARRMNGVEKGLQQLNGKPLIAHVIECLTPQINQIHLNINRSQAEYRAYFPTLPFYHDTLTDFQGPLSGMLSGFENIASEYLLFVPCDTPFLPDNLVRKLSIALKINQAQIAYVHDGERAHPTIALIHHSVVEPLRYSLASGERRLFHFFQTQKSVAVDFSEQKPAFQNINTFEDLANYHSIRKIGPKLLGMTGYSGTGKTTLLEKVIPKLIAYNIRVGLIKHSHHNVELDKPGKDSYRLREAGANPTMIVCGERWALMRETPTQAVDFHQLIETFDWKEVDLILVEGFKHEPIAKIQLHRQAIEKPLPALDQWTIATATDYPLERENWLDINDIEQISRFIYQWLKY